MSYNLVLREGFNPPLEITLGNFSLEALQPKHNERDFEALTSSRDHLRKTMDPKDFWPDDVKSLEDNLRDLTKDFQEFQDRLTFRYAILTQNKSSYDGCLYIRPAKSEQHECCVEFWFKTTQQHLEDEFHEKAKVWLFNTWGFREVAFPGREISWDSYHKNLSSY